MKNNLITEARRMQQLAGISLLKEGIEEQYPVGTKFHKPDGNQTITILSYEGNNVKIQATMGGEKEGSGFKHTWPASDLEDIIKDDNMTILKEGILNEAQEMDMAKSFLENKGLSVEAIKSGNEGHDKGKSFAGISNPESDKSAYIWDGGEGDMNNKYNGKEAFYVYMPFNAELLEEMKSKFPIINVGGRNGTYYEVTIEKK